jgi:hypothetical protein
MMPPCGCLAPPAALRHAMVGANGDVFLPRLHGFERPTWRVAAVGAVAAALYVLWFMLLGPLLPIAAAFYHNAVFGCAALAATICAVAVMLTGTEDDGLHGPQLAPAELAGPKKRDTQLTASTVTQGGDDDGDAADCRACHHCRREVAASSRHCADCAKCVAGHVLHCRWLNTCVGAKNARWFTAFVAAAAVALIAHFSAAVILLVAVATGTVDQRLQRCYGAAVLPLYGVAVALIAILDFACVAWLALLARAFTAGDESDTLSRGPAAVEMAGIPASPGPAAPTSGPTSPTTEASPRVEAVPHREGSAPPIAADFL